MTPDRLASPASDQWGRWPWFVVWALLGGGFAFGVLSLLSIGAFVLPVVLLLAMVAGRRAGSAREVVGLVSGAGVPVIYLAWLNRGGPGDVCRSYPGGASCTQEWSPWPFVVLAIVLVTTGVAIFAIMRRRTKRGHETLSPY